MNKFSKLPIYIIEVVLGIMALIVATVLLSAAFFVSIINLAFFILIYLVIKSLKVSNTTKFTFNTLLVFLFVVSMTVFISNGWWVISLPVVLGIALMAVLLIFLFVKINSEKFTK